MKDDDGIDVHRELIWFMVVALILFFILFIMADVRDHNSFVAATHRCVAEGYDEVRKINGHLTCYRIPREARIAEGNGVE